MTGNPYAIAQAKRVPSSWIVLFFLSCFLILLARNSFPFVFPTFYGEDGTWVGAILRDGAFHTAFNARPEFPVLGVVLSQALAVLLSKLLFGGDITSIPLLIAVVSGLILSLVATLPLLLLQDALGRSYAFLLGVMIVCLPVGADGDEIFGRLLNIGFYATCVAQMLFFCVLYRDPGPWQQGVIYVVVLILMLTFPVVIGQFFLFLAFHAAINWKAERRPWRTWLASALILGIVGASLAGKNLGGAGGANMPFKPEAFVEFAAARSILYPLLAPVYQFMNNSLVVALLIGFLILAGALIWISRRTFAGLLDYRIFFLLNFLLVLLAMLVMRNGLTQVFTRYESSFPDRYFVGLNIGFLMVLISLLASSPDRRVRKAGLAALSVLVVAWIAAVPVFESATPRMADRRLGTVRDTVCAISRGTAASLEPATEALVTMPTYPVLDGYLWRISVPSKSFQRTAGLQCHGSGGPAGGGP